MPAAAIFQAGSAEARRSPSQPERERGCRGIQLPEGNGIGCSVQTGPTAGIFSETVAAPERSEVASLTDIRSRVRLENGGAAFEYQRRA